MRSEELVMEVKDVLGFLTRANLRLKINLVATQKQPIQFQ